MKKKLLLGGLLFGLNCMGQTYTPLQLNGYNADVITEGVGTALTKTTNDVDGVGFCFKSQDWQTNAQTPTTEIGLPTNGLVTSYITQQLTFQLASYTANNSLRLAEANTPLTTNVTNEVTAKNLYILATSGNGNGTIAVQVNFEDNTSQNFENVVVNDWFDGWFAPSILSGFGRVNRTTDEVETPWGSPNLFQYPLELDIINQTKTIQSITYTKTAGDGIVNIFAVSVEETPSCPPPVVTTSSPTINSVEVTLQMLNVPYTDFYYEVRTFGAPGSGNNGLVTSNTESNTNFTITNLSNSSTYYLYVKTNCSATESGPYSEVAIFNTLCDVITNYTQNFNTTLPDTLPHCWSVISSGEVYHGSNDWDGIDETYCYSLNSSWDSTPTDQLILVSPQTNDLGNGTYRIRFKAKGSSWTEETTVLNIVRLNGTTNDATITLIEALELTGTYEEYFVNLPTTTDDYFGFQHPLNGAFVPIYLEDVVYEPIPSCPNVLGLSATQDFSTLTAQLSWNGPGDNFEIEWGNQNFNFGEGTTVTNIPTNSTEITVSGEGIYSYYVRRNCGDGDFSPWTGPFNFIVGYCQSVPTSQDGDGISNISYNGTTYDLESVPYQFMTEIPVLYSNYENTSEVTFITSYPYTYHMWIDINGNGVFESSELVNSGNSLTNNSPEISSTTFELGNIPSGIYRMRFGSADSGQDTPNPCYSGSWGVTIDSNVEITSPCFLPETIEFLNITTNSSTLTTSYPNQTYTVEYGIEGFIQGNGIILTNVSNGYTIENLESGQTYDVYLKVDCEETIVHEWSEVQQFTTLCNTPIPTGETTQILIHDQTFADIELNGENINIYATTDHQNPIPLTNTIQAGTYYATQTLDCESDSHLTVNIQVVQRVAQPTISNPYIVCESIQLNEVSLGLVNNTTVKWYETATSTVELSPNTIVNSDLTYYVTQSDQYSESLRTLVNFTISAIPPTLTTSSVVTCGNTFFNQIVLDETYQGELIWFTNELSAAPINGQTVVTSGIYYVSQKINTCLSERKMIQITANAVVPTPGANVIDICGTGIISDLDPQGVTGASFNWYSTLTSNVVLGPNTNLNTATYYVEQVINGCASQRKAVSVRVNSKVAPVVNNSSICQNTRFVDIVLPQNSGVTYKFYTTSTATSAIDINSIINTGTYYLARVSNGCESNRSAITLTVLPIPNAPTGITTQTFDNNLVTIADLEMDQENITWYITYNDAVQGTNPLLPTTPLVNGQTYYAVDTLGSCRSLPTAVLVEILLSNQSLDLTQLKIYPNPIENEVNVTYSESIDKIEIYSILGQLIQSVKPNTDQTSLEVSNLSSGTYLLKVFVGEQTQTVKVVKK